MVRQPRLDGLRHPFARDLPSASDASSAASCPGAKDVARGREGVDAGGTFRPSTSFDQKYRHDGDRRHSRGDPQAVEAPAGSIEPSARRGFRGDSRRTRSTGAQKRGEGSACRLRQPSSSRSSATWRRRLASLQVRPLFRAGASARSTAVRTQVHYRSCRRAVS